ncbi:LysM peptidoglycan-binding domain-containing M23 family metallopeptidase [Streptomyces sp. NBC_00620]|uniref:M23 family metallopeptidase n=1 Tax=Streptomyces sp. NBC_00620 TaxID=2903666 RepID=UPI00225B9A4A|nr:LysM peptidoglycan-binding domain-containing M23 family metallopeptidase [Streptomyces sp. NBC_00620]MCX4978227.1 LysM peptidoglycan-binding domain-containing M23 family metallopeptidase [Streptomyces sp. NBC_00620]
MPAKGKHRRPKSQRFTRSIAVAGTGGAALALPLMGATGAHAATPTATVSSTQEKAATAQEKAATSAPAAAKKTATKTYAVKAGDSLSKIATDQSVSGGWKKLYSDNRKAVGEDPALIHPGLKLTIGKKAASSGTTESSAKSKSSTQSSKSSESSTKTAAETTTPATDTASSSGYTLPVEGATVGTAYKTAGSMWSSGYHTGVDFVVPTGTTIKSIAAGTVVSAGWGGAYGNQVVIQHTDGQYSQYAHMSSLSVSAGQTVTEGQQIGLSGATGNVTGPHLHFEIRTTPDYGSDVDPVAYLRAHGVTVG